MGQRTEVHSSDGFFALISEEVVDEGVGCTVASLEREMDVGIVAMTSVTRIELE